MFILKEILKNNKESQKKEVTIGHFFSAQNSLQQGYKRNNSQKQKTL